MRPTLILLLMTYSLMIGGCLDQRDWGDDWSDNEYDHDRSFGPLRAYYKMDELWNGEVDEVKP